MTLNESSNPQNAASAWTTRRVIVAVLVVILVFSAFLLVFHFREIAILVFTGIVISISMAPVVNWLHLHKIPRSVSTILVYLSLLLFLVIILVWIVPQIVQQAATQVPNLERYYESFHSLLAGSSYFFFRQLAASFPSSINLATGLNSPGVQTGSADALRWTVSLVTTLLDGLFTFCVVLLIGFYWTLEGERVLYSFYLLLPNEKRQTAREIIEEIEGKVGGYVTGQGLLALAIGVAALIAYSLIQLPSVGSLAFLAGLFELVPIFGPTLGAIPAVMVAFSVNPSKVLWVIGATVVIQMLENHFLSPRVMQKTVGVNPIVIILAFIGFGSLFGFGGLLLAIPLAAVLQVLLDRSLLHPQRLSAEEPAGRDSVSKLSYDAQEFVQDVRKWVRGKQVGVVDAQSDELEDTIESIAVDLNNLLDQVNSDGGSK